MPALKPDHIFVTNEEDAAITKAALSDPDCPPLTAEDFARMRPAREMLPKIFGAQVAARMLDPQRQPSALAAALKGKTDVKMSTEDINQAIAAGYGAHGMRGLA